MRSPSDIFRKNHLFYLLGVCLFLSFAIGGGARSDIESLMFLQPFGAICLGVGLWGVTRADFFKFRFLFVFAIVAILLVLVQLIPLPPSIWMALPGREVVAGVARAAGIAQPWRPVSLVPSQTWTSLYSLVVPCAVMVLAVRCTQERRRSVLSLILCLGFLSGIVGILQAIGPADGPLYFYNVTNNGSAVGLFANHNHQAALLSCLFPMLAVFASTGIKTQEQLKVKKTIAIIGGALIIPLLLVTGSRAGLLLGAIGLASVPLLYRAPNILQPARRKVQSPSARYAFVIITAVTLVIITVLAARANSITRLLTGNMVEETRFSVWSAVGSMVAQYFPFGTGFGTFAEIYQIGEPEHLLGNVYFNHAHNDWLEMALTGGLPAILVMLAAVALWVYATAKLFLEGGMRARSNMGRLGIIIILILGVASIVDYPLRVPSISGLFAIALVWVIAEFATNRSGGHERL